MRFITLLASLFVLCSSAYAEVILPKLLPSPQIIKTTGSGNISLNVVKGFVLEKNCENVKAGIDQVNAKLKELKLQSFTYLKSGKPGQSGTIWLGIEPDTAAEGLFNGLPRPGGQGYRLVVGPDSVVILGKDLPGLFYGLMTLKQLIQADGTLPQITISDWPDLKMRGTYVPGADTEDRIKYLASLKLNFIVFETGEFYYMNKPDSRARWQKLFDICRKNFIEPIPELQSFGHGNMNIDIDPRVVEGVYRKNMPATVKNGEITLLRGKDIASNSTVINADFEKNIGVPEGWDVDTKNGEIAITDSEKYSGKSSLCISHQTKGTLRASQVISCMDQSNYKFSCNIKLKDVDKGSDICSGGYAEVYGVFDNGDLSPSLLSMTKIQNGTIDWNQISFIFNTQQYKKICFFLRLQDSSGSVWFDDLKLTCLEQHDQISPNIIITHSSPLVVTDKTGSIKYKENKDYSIIPGDPIVKVDSNNNKQFYPTDGKPIALKFIPGGKIKDGDELLISYNFAPMGSVSCCPSEPIYRNMMKKAIYNAIKALKCKYIHIGHDEPQALNRDSRCKARGLNNVDLYVDEIKRMREYVREADPNCKMMMWDDSLNPYSNAAGFGLQTAAKNLPRDIIMNAWAYGYPGENEKITNSIRFWLDLGFDITGSPWYNVDNAHYWDEALKERKINNHLLGSFYTAWVDDIEHTWLGLTTSAQYAWSDTVPYEEFKASIDK